MSHMTLNEKKIHLCAKDKTTVLVLKTSLPIGISERADSFYRDAAGEFEKVVRGKLHAKAESAYEANTDKRKFYRYTPWLAEFRCIPDENGGVELIISENGTYLRHEKHRWDGNILMSRKRLKH